MPCLLIAVFFSFFVFVQIAHKGNKEMLFFGTLYT